MDNDDLPLYMILYPIGQCLQNYLSIQGVYLISHVIILTHFRKNNY